MKHHVISNLPSLLEQRLKEMKETNPEFASLFSDHYQYIKTSLEKFFSTLVLAIFDNERYEQFKKETEVFCFQAGVNVINQVNMNIDPDKLLDFNQHLFQQIFFSIYKKFETKQLERIEKIKLTERLHELLLTSLIGFIRGYLLSKNEQIDRLHEQKVSILGQMATAMAHEIRNPITVINGFIRLMKEENRQRQEDIESWDNYLSICQSEINSLEEVVSNFLVLSKRDRQEDRSEDDIQAYDLNLIFRKMETFCRFYALQKNVTLQFHAPKGKLFASINPQHLEHVCLNVIRNAIDAISNEGQVTFSCAYDQPSNEWIIRCEDNGCGIPHELLDNIFDPFFTTKRNGTGLGLPICKSLVEAMNGRLQIASELNKGTLVEIRIPGLTKQLKPKQNERLV